jgi:hypothetical protein
MYSDEYFLHDGVECGAHSMTDYETAAKKGSVKFPEILGQIKKVKATGFFLRSDVEWDTFWIMSDLRATA